ncbi:MAG: helix-turn-helix transcriptional regulator [Candidatus Binatia bacterium]
MDARSALREAEKYLESCFRSTSPPHVNEFAWRLRKPAYRVSRLFRRATGLRLIEYFHQRQVDRAKRMLETTDLPVKEVGESSAFGSDQTFHRVFKRVSGVSPGQWRSGTRAEIEN